MVSIQNNSLKVSVNKNGGAICGFFDKARKIELFWQGEEKSWTSQDVLIFPIIGRLNNGKYTHNGKEYSLKPHGILRYTALDANVISDTCVEMVYVSNAESKAVYPFDFKYSTTYKLIDKTLQITTKVVNLGSSTLPFQVGAHPAFALAATEKDETCDTSGNFVEFETDEEPFYFTFDANNVPCNITKPFGKVKRIELTKKLFTQYPTLIMQNIKSDKLTVIRRDNIKINFNIGKPPILALWSHNNFGAYICVEPWHGMPDFVNATKEIADKPFINLLKSGKHFEYTYTISI